MDLQWLEDVLVLLEERNMTRAAERRNITQPAFSRRIRSFENWLGVNVLERGHNKIDIGAALISNEAEIRALVNRLRDIRAKIAHYDPQSAMISIAAQHTPVFSTFPDMALQAKHHFPKLKFRMRPGNLKDCVSMFLREDASMLLCYESENAQPLSFGTNIRRGLWGMDYLIPVIGGGLRSLVKSGQGIPEDTPAIVYPDDSYFGEVLNKAERIFSTQNHSKNTLCETAFANGIKELVRKGMGVGWLPYSMVHKELETGELKSLDNIFGKESLEVAIYANITNPTAALLLSLWAPGIALHGSGAH